MASSKRQFIVAVDDGYAQTKLVEQSRRRKAR